MFLHIIYDDAKRSPIFLKGEKNKEKEKKKTCIKFSEF